jgi:hypothetical protein
MALAIFTGSAVQKDWVEDSISWLHQTEFEHTVLGEDIPF